jgi:hypothetical protein
MFLAVQGQGRRITPNPQSPAEPIDWDKKYSTYQELYPQVFLWLNGLSEGIDASRNAGLQRFFDALTANSPSSSSDSVEGPERAANEETNDGEP